jgi:hypothetical protein
MANFDDRAKEHVGSVTFEACIRRSVQGEEGPLEVGSKTGNRRPSLGITGEDPNMASESVKNGRQLQ